MPCHSGWDDDTRIVVDPAMRYELDRVSRLLCELMRGIESGQDVQISPDLAAWWEHHKRLDASEGRSS